MEKSDPLEREIKSRGIEEMLSEAHTKDAISLHRRSTELTFPESG